MKFSKIILPISALFALAACGVQVPASQAEGSSEPIVSSEPAQSSEAQVSKESDSELANLSKSLAEILDASTQKLGDAFSFTFSTPGISAEVNIPNGPEVNVTVGASSIVAGVEGIFGSDKSAFKAGITTDGVEVEATVKLKDASTGTSTILGGSLSSGKAGIYYLPDNIYIDASKSNIKPLLTEYMPLIMNMIGAGSSEEEADSTDYAGMIDNLLGSLKYYYALPELATMPIINKSVIQDVPFDAYISEGLNSVLADDRLPFDYKDYLTLATKSDGSYEFEVKVDAELFTKLGAKFDTGSKLDLSLSILSNADKSLNSISLNFDVNASVTSPAYDETPAQTASFKINGGVKFEISSYTASPIVYPSAEELVTFENAEENIAFQMLMPYIQSMFGPHQEDPIYIEIEPGDSEEEYSYGEGDSDYDYFNNSEETNYEEE